MFIIHKAKETDFIDSLDITFKTVVINSFIGCAGTT